MLDSPAQDSGDKVSPHNFWLQNKQGMSRWKKLLESQAVLKKPTHGLTFSDILPLSSSTRVAA